MFLKLFLISIKELPVILKPLTFHDSSAKLFGRNIFSRKFGRYYVFHINLELFLVIWQHTNQILSLKRNCWRIGPKLHLEEFYLYSKRDGLYWDNNISIAITHTHTHTDVSIYVTWWKSLCKYIDKYIHTCSQQPGSLSIYESLYLLIYLHAFIHI